MLRGFSYTDEQGGTVFGVISVPYTTPRSEESRWVTERLQLKATNVKTFYPSDLVDDQYDGVAYLTTGPD